MNIKIYISVVVTFLVVLAGAFIWVTATPSHKNESSFSVVTSFYPLYFFASEIAGPYAEVRNITPAGAEPHHFEPTPRDIITIEQSDILFINGGGFEPWAEDIRVTLGGENTSVVAVSEGLMSREAEHDDHNDHEEEAHESEEEEAHEKDPHVWLSPLYALRMIETIRDEMIAHDPVHADWYKTNSAVLVKKLETLHRVYTDKLAVCRTRTIVTTHTAFGYLAETYELEQIPIAGISPESEPSPYQLAALTEFIRSERVTHVFFETLASPRLAETLAEETGAKTLVLNPLEGLSRPELAAGEDYFSVMYANLDNLTEALGCTL